MNTKPLAWNFMVVTSCAYLTALEGWSMLWWIPAMGILVLHEEVEKKGN